MTLVTDVLSKNSYNKEDFRHYATVMPLGGGCEVGRSCIITQHNNKTVMFDVGVHPAHEGIASLPLFNLIDLSTVDVCLVSHFHLDHCGALPYLVGRTNFKGRIYMTAQTKAIAYLLWQDYLRVAGPSSKLSGGSDITLYNRRHVEKTMDLITTIDFGSTILDPSGIYIMPIAAGHVVGACQFQVAIDGKVILYTGDYSAEEDRHIRCAQLPTCRPDVLISESTFGTRIHSSRAERELGLIKAIRDCVILRKGKCLLPVFALGRAQELILILEEHWEANEQELAHVPIFYISPLSNMAIPIFKSSALNAGHSVRNKFDRGLNAFDFRFIKSLESYRSMGKIVDTPNEPCVVIGSPGMLQSGTSRWLFEAWAPHPQNSIIMTGYSVKGTLADALKSCPKSIPVGGNVINIRCTVEQFCFSAHADFLQTKSFIESTGVENLILVHGERSEATRLQKELIRSFPRFKDLVHCPEIGEKIYIYLPTTNEMTLFGDSLSTKMNKRSMQTILDSADHKYDPENLDTFMAIEDLYALRECGELFLVEDSELNVIENLDIDVCSGSLQPQQEQLVINLNLLPHLNISTIKEGILEVFNSVIDNSETTIDKIIVNETVEITFLTTTTVSETNVDRVDSHVRNNEITNNNIQIDYKNDYDSNHDSKSINSSSILMEYNRDEMSLMLANAIRLFIIGCNIKEDETNKYLMNNQEKSNDDNEGKIKEDEDHSNGKKETEYDLIYRLMLGLYGNVKADPESQKIYIKHNYYPVISTQTTGNTSMSMKDCVIILDVMNMKITVDVFNDDDNNNVNIGSIVEGIKNNVLAQISTIYDFKFET